MALVDQYFTAFLAKTEILITTWEGSDFRRRYSKLCIEVDDDHFWHYALHFFGILCYFHNQGKILLDGKLRKHSEQLANTQHISTNFKGTFETTYVGSKLEINLPLTNVCADFFTYQTSKLKVRKLASYAY